MRVRHVWLLSTFASLTAFGAFVSCGGSNPGTSPPEAEAGTDATTPGADGCAADCTDATMNDSGADATAPADAGADATDSASSSTDASDAGEDATDAADSAPPLIPCSDASPCAIGSCCSGWCRDLTRDPDNCGSCGNACTGAQFCNGVGCLGLVVDNYCQNPMATVVLDGLASDDEAGAALAAGFGECAPAVTVVLAGEDSGVLEEGTNRPITGVGNTFAAAGGAYFQRGVGYMDTQGLTPVYVATYDAGTVWSFQTRDGGAVASSAFSNLTATHDYFTVMVTTEPASGTLVLSAYGFFGPGTTAAAWYFKNEMAELIAATVDGGVDAAFPQAWYVYEWTDATGNGPSADDAFTLMGSGS